MLISDMYGKELITNAGKRIGEVHDVVLDFEKGSVHSVMLKQIDEITKGGRMSTAMAIAKNSVVYTRVKKVSDTTIIVGLE